MELSEIDAMLAGAKKPETKVPLCLRSDLQAEWERLEQELRDEEEAEPATLAKAVSKRSKELAVEIRALEEQMKAATLTVTLRAMERAPWKELLSAHPPRKDVPTDWGMGYNPETMFDDLIGKTLVDPVLDEERLGKLLDGLTAGQYDKLSDAAWKLNKSDVSVPFSPTASRIAASSGGTSKRQSG